MSRPGHGRAPILLACLLTLLPAPAAVARESREAVGGGWNDAAAWTPRGVPGPEDVPTIPAGVGHQRGHHHRHADVPGVRAPALPPRRRQA